MSETRSLGHLHFQLNGMAWKCFIMTVLVAGIAMVTGLRGERGCGLFQYYDPHMDNCGPCSEICDHMRLTRTEGQCHSQCPDYLIAESCTYSQYYDDVVHSCAPCSEVCSHPKRTGTAQQCSNKCQNYLKSLNCTDDDYFNVADKSCSACSELCNQRDEQGDTIPECFHRCPKYVEKYPPGNIVQGPDSQPDSPAEGRLLPSKENDKSSSLHPGIIVTIVIGMVAISLAISTVIYLVVKTKLRRPIYTPAPSIEVVDVEADITQVNTIQAENPDTESAQQASPSNPICGGRRQEVEAGNDGIGLSGIMECGPHQPSAPCYGPLRESVI